MFLNGQHILESMDSNINKKNYQQVIQFCASSDVEVGRAHSNTDKFFFQMFTVVIHYMKQSRFVMYEYQVKWVCNGKVNNLGESEYDIKISLIKLRDVLFQEFKS